MKHDRRALKIRIKLRLTANKRYSGKFMLMLIDLSSLKFSYNLKPLLDYSSLSMSNYNIAYLT